MSRTDLDTGVAERPQAPKAAARPSRPRPPLSRELVETRILGVLKWVTIAFFVIATVFPFYYMVMLSVRAIEDVALDPEALWPPRGVSVAAFGEVLRSVDDGGQGFLVFLRNRKVDDRWVYRHTDQRTKPPSLIYELRASFVDARAIHAVVEHQGRRRESDADLDARMERRRLGPDEGVSNWRKACSSSRSSRWARISRRRGKCGVPRRGVSRPA